MTLRYAGYDNNWNPVVLPVEGATVLLNGAETAYKTDAEGKVTITLEQAGEITVSAKSSNMILVPPVCKVTVADTVDDAKVVIDGILAYHQADTVQNWINGDLSIAAGIGAEWYAFALSQSGTYDFSAYESALLAYLSEHEVYSASSRQKYALCLAAIGSTDAYIASALNDSIGKQGIMSWVFGLHLLNNGYTSTDYTASEIVAHLLSIQCTDGGWSLTGQAGDVDVTAMTVQALSIYNPTDATVKSAIDRALVFLSQAQQADGDYISYGVSNPESGAQVLIALSALGIDANTDDRFVKNGNTVFDGILKYKLTNGSFSHTLGDGANANATSQVLCAMVAYLRMKEGKNALYTLDHADPENVSQIPKEPSASEPNDSFNVDPNSDKKENKPSYKLVVSIALVGVGGLASLLLFLLKKRHWKSFLALWVIIALAIVAVCVTDIQSKEEYYNGELPQKENAIGTVTVTIRCDTVVGKSDSQYIPDDGIILGVTEQEISEGDTVYDILIEVARVHHIQVENNGNDKMAYIVGIGYLYEFDFGDLSGWVYRVNGQDTSVGCAEYKLSDGDAIEWLYTCSLGEDLP